jgi:NAD+ kinase
VTSRRPHGKVRRAGIVLKAYTAGLVAPTLKLIRILERAGVKVIVESTVREHFPGYQSAAVSTMDVDLVVTIGGDGTILRTMQACQAPVFAVNAGIMGFLAEVPLSKAEAGLKRVLRGDYIIDRRLRLDPRLNGRRLAPCLNEFVVHTSSVAKMIHFEVLRDDSLIYRVRADGVILATPTGSTSYNLSVGGPIIDPQVDAFVLSPIAPFSMATRPIVVPASSEVEVRMTDERTAVLVLDGQTNHDFSRSDRLTVTRSPHDAEFIRFGHDFYERLREKHAIHL